MMDGSYGNTPAAPPDAQPGADETKSVDEQNAGEAAILIAKDKLPPGTKVGDTCTFKASKEVGDEFILEYVKDGKEETGEPTNDSVTSKTESELSALDTQGA